jgi:hypothetical protein
MINKYTGSCTNERCLQPLTLKRKKELHGSRWPAKKKRARKSVTGDAPVIGREIFIVLRRDSHVASIRELFAIQV